jgi:hypothetical protein
VVVSAYLTLAGLPRYVVDHAPFASGMQHIYSALNLEPVSDAEWEAVERVARMLVPAPAVR